jgi:hypothetical protein
LDLIRVASTPDNTAQTWHPPTSNPTLKPRRDAIELIRTSLDPSFCPQTSSGKTTTLPTSAMEPTSKIRPTTKDKEYYLHLQHISPHDALWILYKAIEGDLAAAQHTRTEIREYISDLQSHNEPSPPRTSTKYLPTPGESYVAPKGHSFNESSRMALTKLDSKERSTPIYDTSEKKKPPNPSLLQPTVKASQHTQSTIPNKPPRKCRKRNKSRHSRTCPADNRFKHNRRTYYPGTGQRQERKTQPKQPRTTGTRTLAVPYISTNHLHTKHILNTPSRLNAKRPHCEHKRREWRENDLIP